MKTNRQINECHCDNCRKYEECRAKGVCDRDDGFPGELAGLSFPAWCRESIKACGNAIVPQVALQIFKTIEEYEKQ